jgi:hypothetical protein
MSAPELSSASATEGRGLMRARLLTPAELADWLHVDRSYVYEHAVALGAMRLGDGPKARLRFDLEVVKARLSVTSCAVARESGEEEPAPRAGSRRRRRSGAGTSVGLLPIRGRSEAA